VKPHPDSETGQPTHRKQIPEPLDNWKELIGRTIELRRQGQLIRTARVEDASQDSAMIWLAFEGNHNRQLILKTDGYDIHLPRPVDDGPDHDTTQRGD
jgi:hypothetical protein